MIYPIATRKVTAFSFAMAWLAFVGQGPGYGQPPVEENKIYWTNPVKGIQRASLDGTNVEQLVESDARRPADIALDVTRGKIYWTDGWGIYCSNLDGSNLKPFLDLVDEEVQDEYQLSSSLAEGVTNIALDVVRGKIYWVSDLPGYDHPYGYVAWANLDGSKSEIFFEDSGIRNIALDLVRGNAYYELWSEYIFRSDLDGQNAEEVIDRPDSDPLTEIALDVDGGKIYWANPSTQTIQRADLDGQNIEEVLTVSNGYPAEIALDGGRGKVYWANPSTQTIQRADLDGQNIEVLFNLEGDVLYPNNWGPRIGIALDIVGGKIYWAGSWSGTIQRADLDGSNVEVLFDPIVRQPYGIALYLDKIYWTDWMKGTIQRADLNGQNIEILISGLNRPRDIALLAGDKIYWTEATGITGRIRWRGRFWAGFETGKIQAANLDGSNIKEILTGLRRLGDIALDVVRDKIYWAGEHIIQRADLDGSNVEDIVSESARDIALDVLAGKLYWIDAYGETIQQAELDGSNVEDIVTIPPEREGWDRYDFFTLDPVGNKIYWSTLSSSLGMAGDPPPRWTEFFRSNLDGSNIEEIWETSSFPTDIALHIPHPTSVSTPSTTPAIPVVSGLSPNFPNPFNASTQITYDIAASGPVRLTIYNTLGQPVRTLVDQFQAVGAYQVRWDARDQQGAALAAGVYLVRLRYPGGEQTRRLLLLK